MVEVEETTQDVACKVLVSSNTEFKSNIWKSYLFSIFINFHMISGIMMPFFLNWGGLNFLEVMLLQGFFTMMILGFEIPCGAIADYFSRRVSLILSALVTAFAAFVYGSAPILMLFVMGEILFGFGAALLSGTNQALLYDTLRKLDRTEDMQKIVARNQSMMLIGILISAPIGSMLAITLPFNVIMLLMFIPFMIAMCIAFTFKEPGENLVTEEQQSYIQVIQSGFSELKNSPILRILALDAVIGDTIAFFLLWMYQLYLEDLGVPVFFFGYVTAFMTISQMTLISLTPKLQKGFENKKRFLQIFTMIPGMAFILMAIVSTPIFGVLLILTAIGFGISRKVIFIRAINDTIESDNRATVLSTISMLECVIKGVTYPIIGILVIMDLNLTFLLLGMGLIILAGFTRINNKHLN